MISGPLATRMGKDLPRTSRRTWLKRSVAGAGLALGAYSTLFERRSLRTGTATCPLAKNLAHLDGLKVATLSDFHFDDFGDSGLVREAVRRTNSLAPDVVILPGDFVSRDWRASQPLAAILADLRASRGIFASLGNHDFRSEPGNLANALEDHGIRVLRNELVELDGFAVAGLDSVLRRDPDPGLLTRTDLPVILGYHEPDTFDLVNRHDNLLLQVSGHTHGGQVRVPGFAPPVLPPWGEKYVEGLFRERDSSLYVTRGVGALTIPVRFACPPEISLITFRA